MRGELTEAEKDRRYQMLRDMQAGFPRLNARDDQPWYETNWFSVALGIGLVALVVGLAILLP